MNTRLLATTVGAAALGLSLNAFAATVIFEVPLDGHQQVTNGGIPDQGDLDGTGLAVLTIDSVNSTIDWVITTSMITLPPMGAHIHNAAAGANGNILVDFSSQLSGTGLMDLDLQSVLANPTNFYVNIHNIDFPSGAIRGQLGSPVPAPSALLLFATAFAAGLTRLRRR